MSESATVQVPRQPMHKAVVRGVTIRPTIRVAALAAGVGRPPHQRRPTGGGGCGLGLGTCDNFHRRLDPRRRPARQPPDANDFLERYRCVDGGLP